MKGWLKSIDNWVYQNRALSLFLAVVLTLTAVAVANWVSGSDLFRQFFYPKICDEKLPATCDPLEWKDLFQAAILVLGLPVAFLLWHWRDTNVRDQIAEQRNQVENSRKDTILKEFQEVQLRAAGALDENLPQEAREQLQIAALHQLRQFLRGDYDESFRRPAFELFCAGLGQTEVLSFGEWRELNSQVTEDLGHKYTEYVDGQHKVLGRVSQTRNKIISEEWRHIFRSGFPLRQRNFSFVILPSDADLSGLDLTGCRFIRSGLDRVNFGKSIMRFTVLDRTFANGACFSDVEFFGASMIFCGLSMTTNDNLEPRTKLVDFKRADLSLVNLSYSVVLGAQFQGAKVCQCHRHDAQFAGCEFDNSTEFVRNWRHIADEERNAERRVWLDLGAINVDAPPTEPTDG
jgi:hypothetical protein